MTKRFFLMAVWILGAWAAPETCHASGNELPSLVRDIGLALMMAGILATVFTKLRIPNIAAFLTAGAILGPIGSNVVSDTANIEVISQLGLVLLLFLIGLELDLRKLLASGKTIMVSGFLQMPLCIAFGIVAAKLLIWAGIGTTLLTGRASSYVPLYIGFLMAASSTLLVVKLFQETFQMDTVVGRVSLGILIFQDIWSIIIIALQPNFQKPEPVPILLSFLGIAILTTAAAGFARYIIPMGFRWIAKMPELILVAALAWCFLVVFAGLNLDEITFSLFGLKTHLAVGASMGALIAGISMASLPYSTDVLGKVGIVKDFFVTLFFVGLGMGIPMPQGLGVVGMAVVFSLLTVLARFLVFFPLLYFTGLDRRNAMVSSVRLAQVSEFTLVITYTGLQLGHIDSELNSAIIFTFVITALLTPVMYFKADAFHDGLARFLDILGFKTPPSCEAAQDECYSVALLGFHRVASSLIHEIKERHPELLKEMLVVDFNVAIHGRIAEYGPKVKYGDLSNAETLHHAGIDKAKVILCTIPDDLLKGTNTVKIVREVRNMCPDSIIVASALGPQQSGRLYEAGADFVLMPSIETAEAFMEAVIQALNGDISRHRAETEARMGRLQDRREVMP